MRQSIAKHFGLGVVASAFLLGGAIMPGSVGAHEGVAHPAHVHAGTCAAPGDVLFPLADVAITEGDSVGSADAVGVDASDTTIEVALADLVGGEHAIVVHESAENIGNYILCGDIGGPMMGESDLAIGLAELNESGAAGVALLHDNGDGTTDVNVYVTESAAGGMGDHDMGDMGSPAADAGASDVTVEIKDFAFGDTLEIAVGTTVTFTNLDSAPHTVTDKAGSFQSNKIDSGGSWSYTFDTAGEFDYFCEYHANMAGKVIVS